MGLPRGGGLEAQEDVVGAAVLDVVLPAQNAVNGAGQGFLRVVDRFHEFPLDGVYLVQKRHAVGGKAEGPRAAVGAAGDAVIVNGDFLRQAAGAVADGVDDPAGGGTG